MHISRRQFLDLCKNSVALFGAGGLPLVRLEKALANTAGPTVVWLQGSGCNGCSVSFLNYVSDTAPTSAADVLINFINLRYHPTLMAPSGGDAAAIAEEVADGSGHVLVVEGGVPTAFDGAACWVWTHHGEEVTMLSAVQRLAAGASAVLALGNCATWGGIPAAGPNPTGVESVASVIGRPTINVAGCPTHPDWLVWVIAQLLSGNSVSLDSHGRPSQLFSRLVHAGCPRRGSGKTNVYGVDHACMESLGCRGKTTQADCPTRLWNGGANWCAEANAPCIGCTDPAFPFDSLRSNGGSGKGRDR